MLRFILFYFLIIQNIFQTKLCIQQFLVGKIKSSYLAAYMFCYFNMRLRKYSNPLFLENIIHQSQCIRHSPSHLGSEMAINIFVLQSKIHQMCFLYSLKHVCPMPTAYCVFGKDYIQLHWVAIILGDIFVKKKLKDLLKKLNQNKIFMLCMYRWQQRRKASQFIYLFLL